MSLDSLPNASFTFDDVSLWPGGVLSALESAGVLKRGGNALTVTCDGCGESCLEDVEFCPDGNGSLVGYVLCQKRDDIGRVRVAPDRLRTWEISLAGLATVISQQLGEEAQELLPGRLWMVGSVEADGARTEILLARGLGRPDGDRILSEAKRRNRGRSAVIMSPTPINSQAFLEIVPLDEVLQLDGNELRVDTSAIRQALERAQLAGAGALSSCRYMFNRGVDTWAIVYDGNAVHPPLRNTKGLAYLAFLLANPDKQFYALQIIHEVEGKPYTPEESLSSLSAEQLDEYGLSVSGFTDAGEIMDEDYEADVRRRITEFERRRESAEAMGDLDAVAKAESQLKQYKRALSAGIGKYGRHRTQGNALDKARVAVTQAIGRALKKLREQCPALYEHLRSNLHTGTTCKYTPPPPSTGNSKENVFHNCPVTPSVTP